MPASPPGRPRAGAAASGKAHHWHQPGPASQPGAHPRSSPAHQRTDGHSRTPGQRAWHHGHAWATLTSARGARILPAAGDAAPHGTSRGATRRWAGQVLPELVGLPGTGRAGAGGCARPAPSWLRRGHGAHRAQTHLPGGGTALPGDCRGTSTHPRGSVPKPGDTASWGDPRCVHPVSRDGPSLSPAGRVPVPLQAGRGQPCPGPRAGRGHTRTQHQS